MKLSSLYTTSNLPYVRLSDTKASGTAGTSYTDGAYRTVALNTENDDAEGICTLSSNQFTLSAGTYAISVWFQQFRDSTAQYAVRLRNTTDSSTAFKWPAIGISSRAASGPTGDTIGHLYGRFTIGTSKALELQIDVNSTTQQQAQSDGENEVYWIVELVKLD